MFLKCYTFLLLIVILNETPAHVIQMKGLQLQVMQFPISLKWEKKHPHIKLNSKNTVSVLLL